MILKGTKVEITDKKTGLVVKRTTTSEGDFFNHKIAVNNVLLRCEQQRINEKPLLNNPFQINHIRYINKKLRWDFESIQASIYHASIQKRFYFAFQQRSRKQWKSLTFAEAEVDFQALARRGLTFVPYPIPLDTSLEKWLKSRKNRKLSSSEIETFIKIVNILSETIKLMEKIDNIKID